MSRCAAILAIFILWTSGPAMAAEKLLTPDLVIGLRVVKEASLSPDGSEAFYQIARPRQKSEGPGAQIAELWHMPVRGGLATRVDVAKGNIKSPNFSPDGIWRSWIGQARDGSAQIYVQKRGEKTWRALTQSETDVIKYIWSPSGRQIAFTTADPASIAEKQAIAEGRDAVVIDHNPAQLRLRVLNLSTGEIKTLTDKSMSVYDMNWSPDEKRIVFTAAPSPSVDDETLKNKLYSVALDDVEIALVTPTWTSSINDASFSPDGKWLVWRGGIANNDPSPGAVFVMPANGRGEKRNLSANAEDTAVRIQWLPGKPQTLLVHAADRQRLVFYTLNPQTGKRRDISIFAQGSADPITNATDVFHTNYNTAFDKTGTHILLVANAVTHPNEIFFGSFGQPLKRLTHLNPELDDATFAQQEASVWQGPDGLRIEGVLTKPVHFLPGKHYPVVLLIHGGSEKACQFGWADDSITWILPQLLAARGYLVLCPNYRGSLGRGAAFGMGEHDDVMGESYGDIVAGLDHLIDQGLADPERTGITGYSWGGLATSWAATYGSIRWKAAVAGGVMTNWITHSGVSSSRMHEQIAHWNRIMYDGNYELFLHRSPIYHVDKANTPTLIMQGELDDSAPTAQAWELYSALRWKGVPVEFVLYPREPHGFIEEAHQQDYMERTLAWFDHYLSGSIK